MLNLGRNGGIKSVVLTILLDEAKIPNLLVGVHQVRGLEIEGDQSSSGTQPQKKQERGQHGSSEDGVPFFGGLLLLFPVQIQERFPI